MRKSANNNKSFCFLFIIVTLIFLLLAILGSLAKYISPIDSEIITLCGLIMPAILICNSILLIIWLCAKSYWSILPLVSLIVNFAYINSVYKLSIYNNDNHVGKKGLTIATYNVQDFNKRTKHHSANKIKDFLKVQNADILCFQEFGINQEINIDSLKNIFNDWKYSVIPIYENKYQLQLAVFSKLPIINAEVFKFESSSNTSMYCDINVNSDTIRLYNVHLQTTSINELKKHSRKSAAIHKFSMSTIFAELKRNDDKRAKQARFLAKHINESTYPIIACGDFNSIPSSYIYHQIKNNKLNDGFISSGSGYMYTYRYMKRLLRIDYIMHSDDIICSDYYLKDIDYSDHNPIFMRFDINKNGS